jgi:glycosyltransferase involved in cell wall biosynthesis
MIEDMGLIEDRGLERKINKIAYSIVIPIYNSENTLNGLFARLNIVFKGITENYEIILIDDCSVDGSWEKMKNLREKDKRVKIIHLLRNFGQHNATMCGFNYCSGDYVITMDDDLQHPPEEIPKLIEKINEGYNAVYGKYIVKKHSKFENFLSKIFQNLMHRILKIPKGIYISSFAIFKSEVIKDVIAIKSSYPFLPALISGSTPVNKITNVEVIHNERKEGESGYNVFKMFKFSLNLLINYSSLPLLLVGIFGFILSILSIGYGAIIIVRNIMDPGYGLTGWNSLMVATTFLGGAILMAIGIIGEYLRRILAEISYEKQYIIGEKDI